MTSTDPATVVRTFLRALAIRDTRTALSLITDDIEWLNTGLPTVRGKGVARILKLLDVGVVGFDVENHEITADGNTVVTHRTDYLTLGRLFSEFPVHGTFTVRDGKISRWDDRANPLTLVTGLSLRRRQPIQS